jgi:phosphonate transport system permease protein
LAIPKRPPQTLGWWLFGAILFTGLCTWRFQLWAFDFRQAIGDLGEYGARFRHPDWTGLLSYCKLMLQTLAIAFWGTVIGTLIALGGSLFGARNLTPSRLAYRITREYFNLTRCIPDPVFAILFLMCIGVGAQAGVFALALHTGGFLGKTICESLEGVDPGTYQGLRSTGASPMQVLVYAGFPSVLREVGSFGIYSLDRNIRMAAVLGIFGAGGIGVPLKDSIDRFRFDQSAAVLSVLVVTLLIFELLSDRLRKALA